MKLFLKNASKISIFMAIFLIGCGDDDENKLPEVVSGFTQTIDEDTGTTTFINVSTKANTYLWDFGDQETSTEINPVKSYAASGDYTVTLTATNLAGASDVSEAILTIVVKDQIALPVTFDDALVIYDATVFQGASFDVVDNPAAGGSNDKQSKVGAINNVGAEFEGLFFDLGADVDLEFNKSITMNFWSDTAIDVLIKLEQGTGAAVEAMASHLGTGWELITFDFESAESFSRLTLFVDGAGTTAGTFYLDDIIQTETIDTTPPVITLVGDAVISAVLGSTYTDAGATANDNFDGDISGQIVVSGDAVDTNVEGEYTINYDVSDVAGNIAITVTRTVNVVTEDLVKPVIVLLGDNPFNLTVGDTFTDPGVTASDDVDLDITANVVVGGATVDTSTAGTYDITYNVSDAAGNAADEVVRSVIVTMAAAENLLTNGDFEEGNVAWSGNAFNIVENGGNSFNEANVMTAGAPSDVNLSQVLEIVEGSTYTLSFEASTGAGSSRTILAGIGLNEDPWTNVTTEVTLSDVPTLFTINDLIATGFGSVNSRVIFDMGADVGVVVIDNVSLVLVDAGGGGGGGGGASDIVNGDFETGDDTGWLFFDNGGASEVTDADSNGGTYSAKITAGTSNNPGIKQERFGVGTILPNQQYQVTFDTKVESLVIGAVVNAFAFSESSVDGDPAVQHNLGAVNTAAGSWNANTLNFTTGANVTGGVSLLLEVVCGGDPGCEGVVYFDNVTFTIN